MTNSLNKLFSFIKQQLHRATVISSCSTNLIQSTDGPWFTDDSLRTPMVASVMKGLVSTWGVFAS